MKLWAVTDQNGMVVPHEWGRLAVYKTHGWAEKYRKKCVKIYAWSIAAQYKVTQFISIEEPK